MASVAARNIFIVGAKRTPFGKFGGSHMKTSATELGAFAAKAALASANVDASLVNSCIIGNVAQTSTDAAYISRHIALKAGMSKDSTALTVNRLCGSGFQAVVSAAQEIQLGEAEIVLAGGAENMSQAPMATYGHNIRWGNPLGKDIKMVDTLWSALSDSYCQTPMGITAENLAEQYGITREETDAYGVRSQHAAAAAQAAGKFASEIAPMEVKSRKGMVTMDADEGPRGSVSLEDVAKLPAVFKKNGTVTAGNASGITDGAAALIVAGEDAVKEHNLTPLVRVVSWGISGVDPTIMGIGPVPAIKQALARANLSLSDMDLVEINEAFAAQYLACEKELGVNREIANVCGGAIALGHPLGASGARILTHLTHQLVDDNLKYAVGAACIGGGQGIAVILERV